MALHVLRMGSSSVRCPTLQEPVVRDSASADPIRDSVLPLRPESEIRFL